MNTRYKWDLMKEKHESAFKQLLNEDNIKKFIDNKKQLDKNDKEIKKKLDFKQIY
jgi:hypothetical protein